MASGRPDVRWLAKARAPVAFCLAGAAAGAALYFGNLAYVSSTARVPAGGASAAAGPSPSVCQASPLPRWRGTIAVGGIPSYVQVAPNGQFAYITNPGARVIDVLTTATDRVSGMIPIPGAAQAVSFSPDSRTAYVSVYGSHSAPAIVFVDTATGK